MIESMYEDALLIDVDKSCYSWLPKGVSSLIISTNYIEQATLILVLWSNEEGVSVIKSGATKTPDFYYFF